ncbi:MAG: hypothetical protein ABIV11_11105 [Gemmatimonadaceae bacterium]
MAAKKSSRSKSAVRGKSKRTAKRSSAKRSSAKRSSGPKSAAKRSSSRTKSPRARARAIVKRTKRVASTVARQAVDLAQSAGHKISETAGSVADRF